MADLIEFGLDSGARIFVHAGRPSAPGPGRPRFSGDGKVEKARETFEAAMGHVRDVAASAIRTMTELPKKPEEVSIEFGVQLRAETGIIVARGEAGADFKIRIVF